MKLTKFKKACRRDWKKALKEQGGQLFSFPEFQCTILAAPAVNGDNCRFAHFTIAHCAEKEKKFRRKTGEFYALNRWQCGEILPITCQSRENYRNIAETLACLAG